MLITDDHVWDREEFESYVEGMCDQVRAFPEERVPFIAHTTPEVVFLFFALWKVGKIAFPISPRLPKIEETLFTPQIPYPKKPTPTIWKESRLATMLTTSGTTGTPKIACHTLANHIYSALGSQTVIPLGKDDRWLLSLPLYHIGGIAILFRCYLSGASMVISAKTEVTHISLVPTQLFRVQDPAKFKSILLGGAALPPLLPPNCKPTYGMTEMSSQIVTDNIVLPYGELKLAQDGEILVRGKTLFQGYWNEPLIVDHEGWFATRDLGRWREGKFEIVGRKDNMFISGGENIQPEEIERIIKATLDVEEAVVVPIPDPEFGARPVAFIRPLISLEALHSALKPHLPKFKWPIKLFNIETNNLKINRKELVNIALLDIK